MRASSGAVSLAGELGRDGLLSLDDDMPGDRGFTYISSGGLVRCLGSGERGHFHPQCYLFHLPIFGIHYKLLTQVVPMSRLLFI